METFFTKIVSAVYFYSIPPHKKNDNGCGGRLIVCFFRFREHYGRYNFIILAIYQITELWVS